MSSLFNEIDDKKKDSVNTHNLLRDNRFTEIEIAIVRKSHTGFRQVKYRRFSLKDIIETSAAFLRLCYASVELEWIGDAKK